MKKIKEYLREILLCNDILEIKVKTLDAYDYAISMDQPGRMFLNGIRVTVGDISEVKRFTKTGHLINAIKFLRDAIPGVGLKEAKDICEIIRDEMKASGELLP
jgi:hypothetical protein